MRKEAEPAPRELVHHASSSASSWVSQRSDELASRRLVRHSPKFQNLPKKRSDGKDSKDPLADLSDCLQDLFKWKSERNRIACIRTQFSGIRSRTSCEGVNEIKETHFLYSFLKRPRLRRMLENQNNKGSLQKTHWRSSTSCRKVWWLDSGRSQSPQWGMWIKRESPVRCRGTSSCYSMDSILSV